MFRPLFILPLIFMYYDIAQAAAPDFQINRAINIWNTSLLPYTLDKQFNETEKNAIRAAIQIYKDNTCINFKEDIDNGKGGVLQYMLNDKVMCNGQIGRYGPINTKIELRHGCVHTAGVHHETMHALGFMHTHVRHDRDKYIKVDGPLAGNYKYAKLDEFKVKSRNQEITTDYGIPYEYNSILHYPPEPGMKPLDPDFETTFGGAWMLFNDWKVINLHYRCNETCSKQITCQNGGYQHPRKCTECVCAQFHKGQFCQEERGVVNLKRGEIKVLHKEWIHDQKKYKENLPTHYDPAKFDYADPLIIKAPEGTRIRVNVMNISDPLWSDRFSPRRCVAVGLDIVDADLTRVGKRFCITNSTTHSFLSTTNFVGYRVFHEIGHGFAANVTFSVEDSAVAPTTVVLSKPQTTTTSTRAPVTTTTKKARTTTTPAESDEDED